MSGFISYSAKFVVLFLLVFTCTTLSDFSFFFLFFSTKELPGMLPPRITYAECKGCFKSDLISKTIFLEVVIFKKTGTSWQRCTYELAVGCTCVERPQTLNH